MTAIFEDRNVIIETSRKAFLSASDKQAADKAISALTPQEKLRYVFNWETLAFLGDDYPVAYFRFDDSRDTTLEDMGALYRNLFRVMVAAKQQAEREKKPLHVIMGEMHGDRTGLAVEIMLLAIASHLKIGHLGIERTRDGFVAENLGIFISGVEEMIAEIKALPPGKRLSEKIKDSPIGTIALPLGARKNDYYLAQFALEKEMAVFANDPGFAIFFKKESTQENQLDRRDVSMRELLSDYANEKQNVISQYGCFHLPGLRAGEKSSAKQLVFNTVNAVGIDCREKTEGIMDKLANPAFLTVQTSREKAELLAGKHEIIHALLPGRGFDNAQDAVKMAKRVDELLCAQMMRECFPSGDRAAGSLNVSRAF